MKKLIILLFILSSFSTFSQSTGGAGNCVCAGDPNTITSFDTRDTSDECLKVYSTILDKWYIYKPSGTIGIDRWIEESMSNDDDDWIIESATQMYANRERVGINEDAPTGSLVVKNDIGDPAGSTIAYIGDQNNIDGVLIKKPTASNPEVMQLTGQIKFFDGSQGEAGLSGQKITMFADTVEVQSVLLDADSDQGDGSLLLSTNDTGNPDYKAKETYLVSTLNYDYNNPLDGWTPNSNQLKNTVLAVEFNDGIARYSYDGTNYTLLQYRRYRLNRVMNIPKNAAIILLIEGQSNADGAIPKADFPQLDFENIKTKTVDSNSPDLMVDLNSTNAEANALLAGPAYIFADRFLKSYGTALPVYLLNNGYSGRPIEEFIPPLADDPTHKYQIKRSYLEYMIKYLESTGKDVYILRLWLQGEANASTILDANSYSAQLDILENDRKELFGGRSFTVSSTISSFNASYLGSSIINQALLDRSNSDESFHTIDMRDQSLYQPDNIHLSYEGMSKFVDRAMDFILSENIFGTPYEPSYIKHEGGQFPDISDYTNAEDLPLDKRNGEISIIDGNKITWDAVDNFDSPYELDDLLSFRLPQIPLNATVVDVSFKVLFETTANDNLMVDLKTHGTLFRVGRTSSVLADQSLKSSVCRVQIRAANTFVRENRQSTSIIQTYSAIDTPKGTEKHYRLQLNELNILRMFESTDEGVTWTELFEYQIPEYNSIGSPNWQNGSVSFGTMKSNAGQGVKISDIKIHNDDISSSSQIDTNLSTDDQTINTIRTVTNTAAGGISILNDDTTLGLKMITNGSANPFMEMGTGNNYFRVYEDGNVRIRLPNVEEGKRPVAVNGFGEVEYSQADNIGQVTTTTNAWGDGDQVHLATSTTYTAPTTINFPTSGWDTAKQKDGDKLTIINRSGHTLTLSGIIEGVVTNTTDVLDDTTGEMMYYEAGDYWIRIR